MRIILTFIFLTASLQAADLRDLTWEINDGKVTITDCDTEAIGKLDIPEMIDGFPVTTLHKAAFRECGNLTSISIPASLSSLGRVSEYEPSRFAGCIMLATINVSPLNPNFRSLNGVLFNWDFSRLLDYPPGKSDSEYFLPETVTHFSTRAFDSHSLFEKISLSKSYNPLIFGFLEPLTYCLNLKEIEVDPDNPYLTTIEGVLFDIQKENLICYPSNRPAASYVVPPETVSLAWRAFYGCQNLKNLDIRESGPWLEAPIVENCPKLVHLSIGEGNNYLNLVREVIGCPELSSFSVGTNMNSIVATDISSPDLLVADLPVLKRVYFDGPPAEWFDVYRLSTDIEVHVWPEHAAAFGGEGATWNNLTVHLRDTSPKLASPSSNGNTTEITISGGPNTSYLLKHSSDLTSFSPVTTITTADNGRASTSLEMPAAKGFFILEEVPE